MLARKLVNARAYGTIDTVRQVQEQQEEDSTVLADSNTCLAFRLNGGVWFLAGLSRLRPDTRCAVSRAPSTSTRGPNMPTRLPLSFSFAIKPRRRCSVPTSAQNRLHREGPAAHACKQRKRRLTCEPSDLGFLLREKKNSNRGV